MKPWMRPRLFLLAFALAIGTATGLLQHSRTEQANTLAKLSRQVADATRQAGDWKAREARLAADRAARDDLVARLLNPAGGPAGSQLLMAVVTSARGSGVQLGPIKLSSPQLEGSVESNSVTASATGSQSQILSFLRLLETGAPVAEVTRIQWSGRLSGSAAETATINLEIILYGPVK